MVVFPSVPAAALIPALLIAPLAGCAGHLVNAFEPDTLGAWTLAPRPAGEDASGRVLLEETIVHFGEHPTDGVVARELTHSVQQPFTPEGAETIDTGVGYSRSFTTVEEHVVRLFDTTGRPTVVGRDKVVDAPQLGSYYLYSDARIRSASVRAPTGGAIELATLLRHREPTMFAFGHTFGSRWPVERSRFVVEVPDGWEIDIVTEEGGAPVSWAPVETRTANGRRLTWTRERLPPMAQVELGPSWWLQAPRVSIRLRHATTAAGVVVAGPEDVPALSRLGARLMADRAEVTPAIEAIIHDVLGDEAQRGQLTPRQKAARLYAWTRDSIAYCMISIGMGGWVPHHAGEVEKLRYGDCKDKANLLRTLLKAVQVPSRIVTIHAGLGERPFRLPVIAGNFNHAIVVVDLPEGAVYVDPTTRTVAFDDLPPSDEERVCLPADEAGSDLQRTPTSSIERDRRRLVATLKLTARGNLDGTLEAALEGHFADGARAALLETPEARLDEELLRHIGLRSLKLAARTLVDEKPPVEPTPMRVKATLSGLHRNEAGTLNAMLSASHLVPLRTTTWKTTRPDVDLLWAARGDEADEVRIQLDGIDIEKLPAPASGETPSFAWSVSWTREGDTLVLRRTLQHRAVRVPAADVRALRDEVARYARAHGETFLLHSKPASTTP